VKVLFDTNVIVDLLLEREPHAHDAAKLFSRADAGKIDGLICATSVTTVHYLCHRSLGRAGARRALAALLSMLEIAPINRTVVDSALSSKVTDFEDAVISEAARHAGADVVVTRNARDFRKSSVPTHTPTELIAMTG